MEIFLRSCILVGSGMPLASRRTRKVEVTSKSIPPTSLVPMAVEFSARAGASGTQLSKIHAAHSLGASKRQILRYVIFPNSLPEILTGIRVAVGMCWGTLVAAEFLAGTTGIGFVENVVS